jgi:CRP-like cAMP-binding protein
LTHLAASGFTLDTSGDGNLLLAALPTSVWLELRPQLERVDLPLGVCLHGAGSMPRHVYFPTTAIVSLVSSMRDGASAEVAVVGHEGVVGICACMGGAVASDTAVVQAAGQAWRMGVPALVQQAWRSEAVMRPLLRYGQALVTHIAQTSACNRLHGLEPRLCRWLLSMLDRQHCNEVLVTQDRIAAMLGVRREGVTAAALKLQKAGIIRYVRGHISVLDRAGLEAGACACHAVIKSAHDSLLDEADVKPVAGARAQARPQTAELNL